MLELEDSPMKTALFSVAASACLLASPLTYAGCSGTFADKFAGAERLVDSLGSYAATAIATRLFPMPAQ